jgi:hypothetical protein
MPIPARPSPAAYTATITAFDWNATLHGAPIRPDELAALDGRTIPITPASPSPFDPCVQAELAIQDAVCRALPGRVVSAALWRRDRDLGDVSVWHEGRFLPIAIVELTPARTAVAA